MVDLTPRTTPIVSCLMATCGRHSLVEQALACFLRQDYPHAELIILNNHAVAMRLDLSIPQDLAAKVRIVNEPCYATLGACRNRLLDLARGQFVRTWDDDDIYLPWSIHQGVYGFEMARKDRPDVAAFKPLKSWFTNGGQTFTLEGNAMEASLLVRTDITKKFSYRESGGDEHSPLLAGLEREGGIATADVGIWSGYCYTWGCNGINGGGGSHISGTLGAKGADADITKRTTNWMKANRDCPNRPLTPDYAAADDWYGRISKFTGEHQAEFVKRCRGGNS